MRPISTLTGNFADLIEIGDGYADRAVYFRRFVFDIANRLLVLARPCRFGKSSIRQHIDVGSGEIEK